MIHLNTGTLGVRLKPNPTVFQKTLAVNDYYGGAADGARGHVQLLGKLHRRLVQRVRHVLRRSGYPLVFTRYMGDRSTAHQCGTLRSARTRGRRSSIRCAAHTTSTTSTSSMRRSSRRPGA
jgi:hypothetical protein